MTQDEVDFVYEYLHKNYSYKDGELISNRTAKPIGSFTAKGNSLHLAWQISISGKKKCLLMKTLIYIYHYKKYNRFFGYADKNPMNLKIENLVPLATRARIGSGISKSKNSKGFRVTLCIKRKSIYCGTYNDKIKAEEVFAFAKNIYESGCSLEKLSGLVKNKFIENAYNRQRKLPKGVYEIKNKKRISFVSRLNNRSLGTFYTPEEAHQAYLQAKQEYANDSR